MNFSDYFNETAIHSDLMNFVRSSVLAAAPQAQEKISYNMPAWARADGKTFFYVAPAKKHLGLYPHAAYIEANQEKLLAEKLKFSKGAIQIPFDYPREKLGALVEEIVRFNLEGNHVR
ncbi:MAG: DUF1801 domain-containing protein [Streptococcaceae bacterium]|jgi:uncharacterized protein YdhG (YjbR/CyaY superfamily)|nr:DUF1801 domain-containing protein [Streptococcaceae bacterium]